MTQKFEDTMANIEQYQEILSKTEKGTGTQMRMINPNKTMKSNNTSGVTGVSFCKNSSKPWVASICIKGKRIQRHFETKEDAIRCRMQMEDTFHRPIYEAMQKELRENGIMMPPSMV